MANWWDSAPPVTSANTPSSAPVVAPAGSNWWDKAPPVNAQPSAAPGSMDFGQPPPGVVIHGKNSDYVSDRPDISLPRNAGDSNDATAAKDLTLLKSSRLSQGLSPAFQGASFGWGDEAVSGVDAALNAARGGNFNDTYNIDQQAQKMALDRMRAAHPYISVGSQIAGALPAAVFSAPVSAAAEGGGVLTSAAAGGFDGLLQGLVTGAGSADAGHRTEGAVQGGEWGGPLGIVGGATAPLLGSAVQGIRNWQGAASDPVLAALPAAARNYAANITNVPAYAQQLQDLGPQGMLADVSPQWFGVAGAGATRPSTREAVVNALTDRQAGSNARLGADLDASLGRAVSPRAVDETIDQARQATGPLYGPAIANASAVDTTALANNLDTAAVNLRGPAQRAVQNVRAMLDIHGSPGQLDPNPGTLLQTRHAIDGLLATEADPNAIRQLTLARNQVNNVLQQSVPGIRNIDAQFEQIMQQRAALQQGANVLDSGKTAIRPEDLRTDVTTMAQPTGTMVGPSAAPLRLQQGTRAEIDRVMGTNANDSTAWGRLVRGEGDWNRDKLAAIYGQGPADQALAAGDREATFRNTYNQTVGNSQTALRTEFGKTLNDMGKPGEVKMDATPTGLIIGAGQKVLKTIRANAAERNAQRFADQLSQLSVATGANRDAIVQALMATGTRNAAPLSPGMQAVVNSLSGTPLASEQVLSNRYGRH